MKRPLAWGLCAVAVHATATAHVLDEYVEATQISLTPDGARVELRMTPGVQVADRIIATIDGDGDGEISPTEERAYARRVLHDIALDVDGDRAPLTLTRVEFPSQREMSEGVGAIRLELTADADLRAAGEHHLSFRNDHMPELGVYLANALVPETDAIKISGQQRDPLQRELHLDVVVASPDARTRPPWIVLPAFSLGLTLLLTQWQRLSRLLSFSKPADSRKDEVA